MSQDLELQGKIAEGLDGPRRPIVNDNNLEACVRDRLRFQAVQQPGQEAVSVVGWHHDAHPWAIHRLGRYRRRADPIVMGDEAGALRAQVDALQWYHTLELPPGVLTPGWFDTRGVVASLPLPRSLEGKRCLDVGTFDGFWAFEMERRGADEVVAIDVLDPLEWDWPANTKPETVAEIGKRKAGGAGFDLAKRALGSSVRRIPLSVYDLSEEHAGRFDFVYLGSLLLHLRDPVRALERLRGVCTDELLVVDSIDLLLTAIFPRRPVATLDARGRPWWWTANRAGIVRMVEAGGFQIVGRPGTVYMPPGSGQPVGPVTPLSLLRASGREATIKSWRGDPHAVVRAVAV